MEIEIVDAETLEARIRNYKDRVAILDREKAEHLRTIKILEQELEEAENNKQPLLIKNICINT